MENELKVSIGMPVYDTVNVETMLALILALRNIQNIPIGLNFRKGTYVHQARNEIVKTALEEKATHLMFIDSDLTFPPEGIRMLLDSKKDIIGGMYNMKSLPPVNTIKFADEHGNFKPVEGMEIKNEPFKCYAVPTGFMLIRLEAIKDMKNPFDFGSLPDGELIGEDVNFCIRAQKELGLEVWCDPRIKIGHIGQYLY